jgi:hypothetical protein
MKNTLCGGIAVAIVLCHAVNTPLSAAEYARVDSVGVLELLTNEERLTDLEVSGDHAYLAWRGNGHPDGGIVVVDISEPTAPHILASLALGVSVEYTALFQDRLYASWCHWSENGGIYRYKTGIDVIDLTEPSQPTKLGRFEDSTVSLLGQCYALGDNIVVLSTNVVVLNLSDPASIRQVAAVAERLDVLALDVSYAYACRAGWDTSLGGGVEIVVIDFDTPTSPTVVSRRVLPCSIPAPPPEAPRDVLRACFMSACVQNGIAYFGWGVEYFGGVVIVDVTDIRNPVLLHEAGTYCWVTSINLLGHWAILTPHHGVDMFDVSEPRQAHFAGRSERSWDSIPQAKLWGDLLLVAANYPPHSLNVFKITELPAITRQSVLNSKLNLQWNEPARGMKLQRATSLINPDWQDMQGSEEMSGVELPLWGGQEYFRLLKP